MRHFTLAPLGLSRRSRCSSPSSILPSILPPSHPASGSASGPVPCAASGPITSGGPGVQPTLVLLWGLSLLWSCSRITVRQQRQRQPCRRLHLLDVWCGRLGPGRRQKCILGILCCPSLLDSPELGLQVAASPSRRARQTYISRWLWEHRKIRVRWVPDGACPWVV